MRVDRSLLRALLLPLPAPAYLLLDLLLQRGLTALALSRELAVLIAESLLALAAWLWFRRLPKPALPRRASPAALLRWAAAALSFALAMTLLPAEESAPSGLIGLLGICLAAPAAEELVYRGLLLRRSEGLTGKAWILGLSALLFAAGHPLWRHFSAALVFGLFLALLYERRQTVLAPLTVHVLVNLLSSLLRHCTVPAPLGILGALAFLSAFPLLLLKGFDER